MSTVIKYLLDGQEIQPFRGALDLVVSAVFGLEPGATVSIPELPFVDIDNSKNSQLVRQKQQDNPVEGVPFALNISNGLISYDFEFYLDYTKMKLLSDVETVTGAIAQNSLEQFNFRAQGITQRLMESKGFLNASNFQNVPYVVENRKTLLERIQLLFQAFILVKTLADEIFKLINISADITTLGVAQAIINLTATLASITVIFLALKNLILEIQESFFPVVLYHSGLKPKTFLEVATAYMGYSAIDFGTLTDVMEKLTILGSKNNQIGFPDNVPPLNSGIFNPSDVGFNLFAMKEQLKNQFRLREAIKDNVYHLRPENDPFWVNPSSYVMPSILIEQTFANNGIIRFNYEDANSSTTIEYATDDSDLHTLDDLVNPQDQNSTGKIISVTTVEPLVVTDQRKVLLKGAKNINIPYTLAVRKDELDDLLDLLSDVIGGFAGIRTLIEDKIGELQTFLNESSPLMAQIIPDFLNRTGAIKMENHFFSVPKMMLLEDNESGNPRIPSNFADIIGAKALYQNYHTWDSFIPGNRNPNNAQETAAKLIHEQVKIPFGIEDFNSILNNPYFSTQDGKTGEFTKIDWNVEGDFAIVDFWVYDNWMTNIEENIS